MTFLRVRRISAVRILIAVVLIYVVFAMIMTLIQRRILFPRHLTNPDPGMADQITDLDRWWLDTDEGPVEAWFLPGRGVDPAHPGPAVIFTHGNAELIEYWPRALSAYRRLGVSLLLPEYRGYGRSHGSPSQETITADLVRFYDRLAAHPAVDRERIVFHGRSIGGGAICALAAKRRPRALILQSTFTSMADMAARFFMPAFLVSDPFDNLSVVAGLDVPLLIVHGSRDGLIPHVHGERLAAANPRARLVSYDSDHNTFPPGPGYFQDIEAFLRQAGVLSGPIAERPR